MAHIPGSRALWLVLLAGLAAALGQQCKADSPSREDGEVREESTPTIVGSWQLVKTSTGAKIQGRIIFTFGQEGKTTVKQYWLGGEHLVSRGTYKAEGKKLVLTWEGEEGKTSTIKTLDDGKLVIVSPNHEAEYKRVK